MKKTMVNKIAWAIVGLSLVIGSTVTDAFAREDRDWGRSNDRGFVAGRHRDEVVMFGHSRYRYRDGRFFAPSFFGFFFGVRPPFGIVVTVLPFGYRTIVVGGLRYYSYGDVYYRDCPSGYVVVPAPAVTANYASVPAVNSYTATGDSIVVNVPNVNGGYTPVRLVRSNGGYIGPQGEFYPGNPTVDQLRALYGR